MADWRHYLLPLAAIIVLAPLLAWPGRAWGSKARGGLMLASVLLGFGAVLDQPAKHAIEATEAEPEGAESGEPPLR